MASWKPEVQTGDGIWTGNALRFATKWECDNYLKDLWSRWSTVTDMRSVECHLNPNYRFIDGRAIHMDRDPVEVEIERSQARLASVLGDSAA
jgi:hypothetical protein